MLTGYLQAAMRHAHYELMREEGTFYGEVAVCPGVYASAPTLEQCREELVEVIEDWVLLRVHRNLPLPTIDGLELVVKKEVAA